VRHGGLAARPLGAGVICTNVAITSASVSASSGSGSPARSLLRATPPSVIARCSTTRPARSGIVTAKGHPVVSYVGKSRGTHGSPGSRPDEHSRHPAPGKRTLRATRRTGGAARCGGQARPERRDHCMPPRRVAWRRPVLRFRSRTRSSARSDAMMFRRSVLTPGAKPPRPRRRWVPTHSRSAIASYWGVAPVSTASRTSRASLRKDLLDKCGAGPEGSP
jgi:hypothetical protein